MIFAVEFFQIASKTRNLRYTVKFQTGPKMRKNTEFGEFDEGVSEVDGGYGNIESAKSSRR